MRSASRLILQSIRWNKYGLETDKLGWQMCEDTSNLATKEHESAETSKYHVERTLDHKSDEEARMVIPRIKEGHRLIPPRAIASVATAVLVCLQYVY